MQKKPRYYVYTWEYDKGWTPQPGVKAGPWSKWGLRRAIAKLRACGYPCNYSSRTMTGDPSVKIVRDDRKDAPE